MLFCRAFKSFLNCSKLWNFQFKMLYKQDNKTQTKTDFMGYFKLRISRFVVIFKKLIMDYADFATFKEHKFGFNTKINKKSAQIFNF